MFIEDKVFKKSKVNINKLLEYGFKKIKNKYEYTCLFMNDDFEAYITITENGVVSGKVYDLEMDDEYTLIRIESNQGEFVNKVRASYKDILLDIKNKCFYEESFMLDQSNRITEYIKKKYKTDPEFLWKNDEGSGVFRNKRNEKWFGIIMTVDKSKITKGTGIVEIIDLKVKDASSIKIKGIYPGYHMNKKNWIGILLDDSLSDSEVIKYIDESYDLINKK